MKWSLCIVVRQRSVQQPIPQFYKTPIWRSFMQSVLTSVFLTLILCVSIATAKEAPTLVNADNYARAEAAFQFDNMLKRSGGINKLTHVRQPIPLDRQRNMQMNRDTIYSVGVVDISAGASVTLPLKDVQEGRWTFPEPTLISK
jgi:hypothetical protein